MINLVALLVIIATILQCSWPTLPATSPQVLQVSECQLPFNFRFGTVTPKNGHIVVVGNELGGGYFGQYAMDINPDTCQVINTRTLAYNTAHHDTVSMNGKIITVGGMVRNSSGVVFSSPWAQYDHNQSLATPFSPGLHDPELVKVSETQAISIGGWAWDTTSGQVSSIGDTLATSSLAPLNTPRSYRTAHVLPNGLILVVAGLYRSGATIQNLSSMELVDPTGSAAPSLTAYSLAVARRYHSSRLVNGKVYVIAGTALNTLGRGAGLSSVEVVDPVAGTVSNFATLAYPRQHSQTVHLTHSGKDYIAVFGGEHNNTPVTTPELIDLSTGSVSALAGVSWGLTDHDRISYCTGNTLYLVGGEDITPATDVGTNKILKITFDSGTACE